MTRRQRIAVTLLGLITALALLAMGSVAMDWWKSLPQDAEPVPTLTSEDIWQTAHLPPTWTPTLSPTPRPTRTPGPTRTPTETPLPIPISIPTVTPTDRGQTSRANAGPYFAPTLAPSRELATLDDFWQGNARWVVETIDTGLPPETSDTVHWGGVYWSYAHASEATEGIKDQCGRPVPLPGCVTLWKSFDGGRHFALERPVCLFPCLSCPCSEVDHVEQQQYPRVFFDDTGGTMVYEWGAGTFLRTSPDGVRWSGEAQVPGTGMWYETQRSCSAAERIGHHPHTRPVYDCLAGAPPGLYIEDDKLYIFVALGRAPGHMGCFVGKKQKRTGGLRPCAANPLFSGARTYGPVEAASHGSGSPQANPYFDFRTISSADVVRVGDHYYMAYEGTRGPDRPHARENQFGLGFARSVGPAIDGPWEKFPGNPILADVGDHWGIGHADIVIAQEATYLYTTTSPNTRGRYLLVKR